MKRIAFFCIPAYGHHNPMLPVAKELVKRGHEVRFYSFNEFGPKIKETGAEFISCDSFLSELTLKEEKNLKRASSSEMIVQDLKTTIKMDSFLAEEFRSFKPDIIYSDSVCFWGKLSALKYGVPLIVSTSTFAFNEFSAKYLKSSFSEIFDMFLGFRKIKKELKELEKYGYNIKDPLSLIKNDNGTNTIVYTTRNFQPAGKSFNSHYVFVGPSLNTELKPQKLMNKPLVYISMGTVVNNKPQFYQNCIDALKDLNLDVIIAAGNRIDLSQFESLPENVKVYSSVNQLEILSKADLFITHSGMNSVSESIYFETPMILNPQTSEQRAVARRVEEIGAGIILKEDSVEIIRKSALEVLNNQTYNSSVKRYGKEYRSAPGASKAADFILAGTH